MNVNRYLEYQYSRSIQLLLEELLTLKQKDIAEYYLQLDELKKDLGTEFYNKYLRESLEPM